MTVVATLFRLDAVDTEIERTEATLRELARRQARNPALETTETKLKSLRAQLQAAEAEQRSSESNLSDLEARIARDQKRMYSGQIVDPRELGSLEREIEHYRQRRDLLEDECLQGMERIETLQSQATALEREIDALRRAWEESAPSLTEQRAGLQGTLAARKEDREALLQEAGPRAADTYARLRTSLGHAVSTVSGGVCGACRVTIPARDVQHARGGEIVMCMNCGRILYAG